MLGTTPYGARGECATDAEIALIPRGTFDRLIAEHRPFGRVPVLSRLFDLRVPVPGDASTVNVGRPDPWHATEPFASRWGPAYRGLYDLADPERSRFIQSTGQSGHRLSPRYGDLTARWARVETIPMRTDRAAIEAGAHQRLRLSPRPAEGRGAP